MTGPTPEASLGVAEPQIHPQVLLALLEVWGTVDSVFSEWGAFDTSRNPGLGRIYRSWRKARAMWGEPAPEVVVELGATGRSTDSPQGGGGTGVRSQQKRI